MKKTLLIKLLLLISISSYCQLVDFFKWTDTKIDIKKYHQKSILLEETVRNQMDEIHYVRFDSGYANHYIYLFKKNILEGVKTHRLSLSTTNSKMFALGEYEKLHDRYVEKYKEKVKQKNAAEQAVRISELHLKDTDIFITIEKAGNEYQVVENFFKKKDPKQVNR